MATVANPSGREANGGVMGGRGVLFADRGVAPAEGVPPPPHERNAACVDDGGVLANNIASVVALLPP